MALINCPECGTSVSDRALACPSCGCPVAATAGPSLAVSGAQAQPVQTVNVTKSRGLYIVLGLVLGSIGFHNFYSGHHGRGAVKFGLVTLGLVLDSATNFYSAFFLLLAAVMQLWALVEVFVVKADASGKAMT